MRWSNKKNTDVESPKVDIFLKAIHAVCEKHGYCIEHEDTRGGFIIEHCNGKKDFEWLNAASIGRTTITHVMPIKKPEAKYTKEIESSELNALVYGALEDLENWLDHECALCGAVGGYGYNSGVEYGLRQVIIEVQKRKRSL